MKPEKKSYLPNSVFSIIVCVNSVLLMQNMKKNIEDRDCFVQILVSIIIRIN